MNTSSTLDNLNFSFSKVLAFLRNSIVFNGVSQQLLFPFSKFFHIFNSQLLVCCINTLLSPSYVQLASFALRNSLSPAANNKIKHLKKKCTIELPEFVVFVI